MKYTIVYLKADGMNNVRPCDKAFYPELEAAMLDAEINERADDYHNTFVVFEDDTVIYESNMVPEYRINIYDYV